MLEGPQLMEGSGMTHALGLTSYILGLVDLCHDAHSYTDLVGEHTCLGTRLSHRHNPRQQSLDFLRSPAVLNRFSTPSPR